MKKDEGGYSDDEQTLIKAQGERCKGWNIACKPLINAYLYH